MPDQGPHGTPATFSTPASDDRPLLVGQPEPEAGFPFSEADENALASAACRLLTELGLELDDSPECEARYQVAEAWLRDFARVVADMTADHARDLATRRERWRSHDDDREAELAAMKQASEQWERDMCSLLATARAERDQARAERDDYKRIMTEQLQKQLTKRARR